MDFNCQGNSISFELSLWTIEKLCLPTLYLSMSNKLSTVMSLNLCGDEKATFSAGVIAIIRYMDI